MPTLRLADYLQEDLVLGELPCRDKPGFLKALAAEVSARLPAVDEGELLERLTERESEQSSGVGAGLALPHAILPGLEKTLLVVSRPPQGLDFAAADSEPVELVFLVLSPPGANAVHLRLLARLARIFATPEVLEKLRAAKGPQELFRMLLDEDARHVF